MIEQGLDDLLHPCGYDLGDVLDGDLGGRHFVLIYDLDGFLPKGREFVGHACSVGLLDVFRQAEREVAFGLDVVGDAVASERYGGIVPHDLALEYRYGTYSGTDVDQGDSVLHLLFLQDSPCSDAGSEILLGDGDSHAVEDIVDVGGMSPAADEHLEVSFQFFGRHSDDVVLKLVETVFGREGLGYRSVDDFVLGVTERIFLEGHRFESPYLRIADLGVRIGPVHTCRGRFLTDIIARQAHYHLLDLDLQFLLGFRYCLAKSVLHLAGVVDVAVAYALRGRFLVVNHLDVLAQDPGHADRHLGRAQVD